MKPMWIKTVGGMKPANTAAEELYRGLRLDQRYAGEFKRMRNARHHDKFFAMMQIIFQNQEHYTSMDDLLDVCKLRIGHVKVIQTARGEERIPKSISWAQMDQAEFEDFYRRAVDWVLKEVIPGLQRAELDPEVERQLTRFAA